MKRQVVTVTPPLNLLTNEVIAAGQSGAAAAGQAGGEAVAAERARIQTPTVIAKTASTQNRARQAMACARCCRQVTQIMTDPVCRLGVAGSGGEHAVRRRRALR